MFSRGVQEGVFFSVFLGGGPDSSKTPTTVISLISVAEHWSWLRRAKNR